MKFRIIFDYTPHAVCPLCTFYPRRVFFRDVFVYDAIPMGDDEENYSICEVQVQNCSSMNDKFVVAYPYRRSYMPKEIIGNLYTFSTSSLIECDEIDPICDLYRGIAFCTTGSHIHGKEKIAVEKLLPKNKKFVDKKNVDFILISSGIVAAEFNDWYRGAYLNIPLLKLTHF